jgi:hypothetical protein
VPLAVLSEHRDLITSAVGWPPTSGPAALQLLPFHGYVVRPHDRHPGPLDDMIEFGVINTKSGQFAAAGLDVSYKIAGRLYSR